MRRHASTLGPTRTASRSFFEAFTAPPTASRVGAPKIKTANRANPNLPPWAQQGIDICALSGLAYDAALNECFVALDPRPPSNFGDPCMGPDGLTGFIDITGTCVSIVPPGKPPAQRGSVNTKACPPGYWRQPKIEAHKDIATSKVKITVCANCDFAAVKSAAEELGVSMWSVVSSFVAYVGDKTFNDDDPAIAYANATGLPVRMVITCDNTKLRGLFQTLSWSKNGAPVNRLGAPTIRTVGAPTIRTVGAPGGLQQLQPEQIQFGTPCILPDGMAGGTMSAEGLCIDPAAASTPFYGECIVTPVVGLDGQLGLLEGADCLLIASSKAHPAIFGTMDLPPGSIVADAASCHSKKTFDLPVPSGTVKVCTDEPVVGDPCEDTINGVALTGVYNAGMVCVYASGQPCIDDSGIAGTISSNGLCTHTPQPGDPCFLTVNNQPRPGVVDLQGVCQLELVPGEPCVTDPAGFPGFVDDAGGKCVAAQPSGSPCTTDAGFPGTIDGSKIKCVANQPNDLSGKACATPAGAPGITDANGACLALAGGNLPASQPEEEKSYLVPWLVVLGVLGVGAYHMSTMKGSKT